MYIREAFRELIHFDFRKYNYYFFTIKHNNSVTLRDDAHGIYALIRYHKELMMRCASITNMLLCFELDSRDALHAHGICESKYPLKYKNLYRTWSVHHKFQEIFCAVNEYAEPLYGQQAVIYYITKCPLPFVVKLFKEDNSLIDTNILIYWDNQKLEELSKDVIR